MEELHNKFDTSQETTKNEDIDVKESDEYFKNL